MVFAEVNGRTLDDVAEVGDTPAPRARDLGDEPTDVQPLDEARDARALPGIGGMRRADEALAEVAIGGEGMESNHPARARRAMPVLKSAGGCNRGRNQPTGAENLGCP